jgi:hypothetical protein
MPNPVIKNEPSTSIECTIYKMNHYKIKEQMNRQKKASKNEPSKQMNHQKQIEPSIK